MVHIPSFFIITQCAKSTKNRCGGFYETALKINSSTVTYHCLNPFKLRLFIDKSKVSAEIENYLLCNRSCVTVVEYSTIQDEIKAVSKKIDRQFWVRYLYL